ncbi:MAG: SMC-Scp complex subunit ScpB [Firmicutes bacterium]|nr:SMC-Scp complex subunit ScpB [Bacillota bacterium]
MDKTEIKQIAEALFFVACDPLPAARVAEIAGCSEAAAEAAIRELADELADGHGVVLRELGGGWQFFTAAALSPYIEQLYRPKAQQLSKAALETLAIIAYKQPISRAEIADIRQVEVDGVVNGLLEKRLIEEVGRRSGTGRAILYGTSNSFLEFFGLRSLADLPPLKELAEQAPDEADAE